MSSELVVYTIPSRRPGALARPMATPFRRVVGMDFDAGETLWTPQRGGLAAVHNYDPDRAEPETLELTDSLTLRARVFFEHFLATSEYQPYNCHSFASFMEGGTNSPKNDFNAKRHLLGGRAVAATWSEVAHPLAMGQRGIIASVRRAKALHSIIGLGAGSPDCLQVTQVRGFMALCDYESVLRYYQAVRPNDRARLYAKKPDADLLY